jgi:hypothetical protein
MVHVTGDHDGHLVFDQQFHESALGMAHQFG